jgi:hypothetical protein
VDCLRLSLLPFYLTKLSLIIYIRKYLDGLPFWHSAHGPFYMLLLVQDIRSAQLYMVPAHLIASMSLFHAGMGEAQWEKTSSPIILVKSHLPWHY